MRMPVTSEQGCLIIQWSPRSQVLAQTSTHLLLVLEMDLPYDAKQVEEYGESFAPMDEGKFDEIITALIRALPYTQFALVVILHNLSLTPLGIPFSRSARVRPAFVTG